MDGSLLDMYTGSIGVLLPMLIAVFKNVKWSKPTKQLLTLALAVAASAGHAFYSGEWNPEQMPKTFLIILALSTTSYAWLWKPSNMEGKVAEKVVMPKRKAKTAKKKRK